MRFGTWTRLCAGVVCGVMAAQASAVEWNTFLIRDNSGRIPGDPNFGVPTNALDDPNDPSKPGTAPTISEKVSGAGVVASVVNSGQKAGYGTSHFDGQSINSRR